MAAASAAPLGINGAVKISTSQAFLDGGRVKETKSLISEQFYHPCNWVSGAGGSNSITIKLHHHSIPKPQQLIVMSLSGGQKERMLEEDMCVLSPSGSVLSQPLAKPRPHKPPKCSDCGPLFMKRVLQRHRNAEVTTKAGTLKNGIEPQRRCILLDIEGTTTPISFVTDVLFPYARDSVRKHLELTYDTAETQDDIKLLRAQVEEDLENDVVGTVPIPTDRDKEDIIAALVANVEAMIKADRKITSLKQLQGHIWQTGFQNKELEAVVYDDVPEAIEKWHSLGIKVYIYSSGSRLAQRLIFGNTNYGDLRKHLCGFFDTIVGNKREKKSYIEIAESLGVDSPSEILFVTDVYQEAIAARAAGLEVIISIRPGNAPLPENHGFHTINSFSEI